MDKLLSQACDELAASCPASEAWPSQLHRLGEAMFDAWHGGGKVLICGNGGSAADAMHLAEELCVRFMKNRRALAAHGAVRPDGDHLRGQRLRLRRRSSRGRSRRWATPATC